MDFQHILDNLFITLNECRMHPGATARKMEDLQNEFQGRIYKKRFKTREGTNALHDLIQDFSQRKTIDRRLKWSFALHLAADEQATILGQRGLVTTQTTSNFKSLPNRVQEYAIVRGRLCEVYEFGGRTAEEILQELLIDDGLVSRKRRNTLMDPIFNYIGIGTSYHEKHQACTVIILAEDIISLVAPDTSGRYKRRKGLKTGQEITVKLYEDIVMDKAFLGLLGGNQQNNSNSQYNRSSHDRRSQQQSSSVDSSINRNQQLAPSNQPHFLLDESSIHPRSDPQRNTTQSKHTFNEQDYLSRHRDRSESQSMQSGQQINNNSNALEYSRDHRLPERQSRNTSLNRSDRLQRRDDLVIRDTQPENRVPDPVAAPQKPKKDSKCSLM